VGPGRTSGGAPVQRRVAFDPKDAKPDSESTAAPARQKVLLYRSEFESAGDAIGSVGNSNGEDAAAYSLLSDSPHFKVDATTGVIRVAAPIDDVMGVTTETTLEVKATRGKSDTVHQVTIVDMYDYLVEKHRDMRLISKKAETHAHGAWLARSNHWGAPRQLVADKDYRIGLLVDDEMPANVILLWDVPGSPRKFGRNRPVWCYNGMVAGNLPGSGMDVPGFPVQLADLKELTWEYDIEKLGDDRNKFMLQIYDSALPPDELRKARGLKWVTGDFLLIVDQAGTWIPMHLKHDLGDIAIDRVPFNVRYGATDTPVTRRRVIVKDRRTLLQAKIDVLALIDLLAARGEWNKQNHVPCIYVGVEVSSGFGAFIINKMKIRFVTRSGGAFTF
jgi:hypothetical protein